jgi:two-component system, cell cycle sensor histidine kinase and response regulator CckA
MAKQDVPPFLSSLAHHAADPFRLLVESVVDYAIFMLDPAGEVASWNPGAERIYGYKAEEIIGQPHSCFYRAEDVARGAPAAVLQTALEQGRCEQESVRVRHDRSQFWAVVTVTALYDHFGHHVGFAKIIRDISERKQAEAALCESEARLRNLFEQASDAILVISSGNRILDVNARGLEMLGYTREEMVRLTVADIVAPHERPRLVIETARMMAGQAHLAE